MKMKGDIFPIGHVDRHHPLNIRSESVMPCVSVVSAIRKLNAVLSLHIRLSLACRLTQNVILPSTGGATIVYSPWVLA